MVKDLHKQKAVLLKQADIFSSLLAPEIELIARNSDFHDYKTDLPVFLQGDSGNVLYIVESGEIVVRKEDESNRKTDIARFVQGNCFGELDLFTETSRIVSAFASEQTRLLVFPKSGAGFTDFLEEHPDLSARILHKILVVMAERIRRANALIKENSPLVQELRKQVYRDKLTGLFNQTFLTEKIRDHISKNSPGFSLLITKPDNFKALNDSYGHDAGDKAIRIMARGLRDFIGDDKSTARYKGNAMAVFLTGVSKDEAYDQAVRIREFMNNLDVSEATEGKEFQITASIGITLFPDHGLNAEELIFKTHELPLVGRRRGGNLILFPEDAGEKHE
ncbi:MAG: GGDEF domain-containing protein [Spirochaetales bacterium]|nr:GGDEF domain-containing protein [Spirochaetales bacterium]